MMIFTLVNVLDVGFLLYVLVQFWKEGHKSTSAARARARMSAYGVGPNVVVVTAPLTAETRNKDGRVIQFPARGKSGQQHVDGADNSGRTRQMPQSAAR